jgi:hypothetical protein
MAQPLPEAFAQVAITLYRKPVELDGKREDENVGEHEHRHRKTQHRKCHHGAIDPGADARCSDHAERHRDGDRDEQRAERQRDGRLDALPDQACDRKIGEDRSAKIAVQETPHPPSEAHQKRLVEAEPGPDALDVVSGGGVACNDGSRIAGGEIKQGKNDERDHRHYDEGREEPPDYIREQAARINRIAVPDRVSLVRDGLSVRRNDDPAKAIVISSRRSRGRLRAR